jgi:hypothetical protein
VRSNKFYNAIKRQTDHDRKFDAIKHKKMKKRI